jgi:hypothetical protein
MNNFEVREDTARAPAGMKIVGVGVIASCLLLSALFAWGIYLDLTAERCTCPTSGEVTEDATGR